MICFVATFEKQTGNAFDPAVFDIPGLVVDSVHRVSHIVGAKKTANELSLYMVNVPNSTHRDLIDADPDHIVIMWKDEVWEDDLNGHPQLVSTSDNYSEVLSNPQAYGLLEAYLQAKLGVIPSDYNGLSREHVLITAVGDLYAAKGEAFDPAAFAAEYGLTPLV